MSDILKRIIAAQRKEESPFFKDAEGRIIEVTASQGEVFTGYYQADNGIYYSEKVWLEQQRQLEFVHLAEEEYQAEQKRINAQRTEREQKKQLLEAQQKKEEDKAGKGKLRHPKTLFISMLLVCGSIALAIVFWPSASGSSQTTPDIVITDTIEDIPQTLPFGNAIITGSDVRMRSEPNLEGKVITYFPNEGERVLIVQPANDTLLWARVRRNNGTEGWVFADYVTEK